MNLQQLIDRNFLEEFNDVSIEQIKKRFAHGMTYLNTAINLLANKDDYEQGINVIIYTNIYNASRNISESYLFLNGYRAKITDHHKTIIQVSKLIMNDPKMDSVFIRLDRMRKNRNKIEYDTETFDVSESTIKQAIEDVQKFADKAEREIEKKDEQQKLI